MAFSWNCPYCNHDATIGDENVSAKYHYFNHGNKLGNLGLLTQVISCPNPDCREYSVVALVNQANLDPFGTVYTPEKSKQYHFWNLKPQSKAKQMPSYIPVAIVEDYNESCLIKDLSPKASAALSRRCLQGMIRNFWGVKEKNLYQEIDAIKDKVDADVWEAIDSVRKLGNIGAHMEKDINLIIEIDPAEADLLIQLIEDLISEWYVNRHNRQEKLNKIINIAKDKENKKKIT